RARATPRGRGRRGLCRAAQPFRGQAVVLVVVLVDQPFRGLLRIGLFPFVGRRVADPARRRRFAAGDSERHAQLPLPRRRRRLLRGSLRRLRPRLLGWLLLSLLGLGGLLGFAGGVGGVG